MDWLDSKLEFPVQIALRFVVIPILVIKIGWIFMDDTNTTDTFIEDVTLFLSLIFASIAVSATIGALNKTRESLELTRQSQRPFYPL